MSEKAPEPYAHEEDGGVLGAVRTQEGRPFRLLS